ncbi:uncharacterized protein LOC126894262 isoform X2 [Daktulosphaira vitifoliae]|uniref:uncharacterized protein LOC126894262 isoform X2 n=1 Tax=Daktulosphaira vitifoliae TaxID=58002 RepID=UPI0021A9AD6C|nr:uncharacterized protein LOC126894262 isoform X2 [Daktulosphaira vitifoliae]
MSFIKKYSTQIVYSKSTRGIDLSKYAYGEYIKNEYIINGSENILIGDLKEVTLEQYHFATLNRSYKYLHLLICYHSCTYKIIKPYKAIINITEAAKRIANSLKINQVESSGIEKLLNMLNNEIDNMISPSSYKFFFLAKIQNEIGSLLHINFINSHIDENLLKNLEMDILSDHFFSTVLDDEMKKHFWPIYKMKFIEDFIKATGCLNKKIEIEYPL